MHSDASAACLTAAQDKDFKKQQNKLTNKKMSGRTERTVLDYAIQLHALASNSRQH